MNEQRSETHEQARNSLLDELKPAFDDQVADYKFATIQSFGRGYVAYEVLATWIRAGWRLSVG
jgi:hypothetical protein